MWLLNHRLSQVSKLISCPLVRFHLSDRLCLSFKANNAFAWLIVPFWVGPIKYSSHSSVFPCRLPSLIMTPCFLLINFLALFSLLEGCQHESKFLKKMLKNHDRRKVPGNPTNVTVEIWVQEISRILEVTSEFELDVYGNDIWMDESLAYSQYDPCKQILFLDAEVVLPQIWTPKLVFVNSKNASIHISPYPNKSLMFYPNGTIWYNYRIKVSTFLPQLFLLYVILLFVCVCLCLIAAIVKRTNSWPDCSNIGAKSRLRGLKCLSQTLQGRLRWEEVYHWPLASSVRCVSL